MAIYLSQHGKCHSSETDPDRKLTDDGRTESGITGKILRDKNVHISRIVHSGKTRAYETAAVFSGYLTPEKGIIAMDGMDPNDSVETFAVNTSFDDTLYVGHLPFMEKLASYLVTGDSGTETIKFYNSGIVCLERDNISGKVCISWTITP